MTVFQFVKKPFVLLLLSAAFLTACHTPRDIAYLQNVEPYTVFPTPEDGYIRFQPGDKLNIRVHSRDKEQMRLFNVWGGYGGWGGGYWGDGDGYGDGYGYGGGYGYGYGDQGAYTVDEDGNIDFPVLGNVNIAGMTRIEVEKTFKSLLLERNLMTDPTITVTFSNMNVAVLGNVKYPGLRRLTKDRTTILEALSMTRDLDIDGIRTNILVMRQEEETRVAYRIDISDADDIYNSPVYYVKQNDVIYIEPNNKAKRNSTVMGSTAYQPGFWISLVSSVASMITSVAAVLYLVNATGNN